jgi:hypothetical protein
MVECRRFEGHRSRVEGHMSRFESRGRGSKVEVEGTVVPIEVFLKY